MVKSLYLIDGHSQSYRAYYAIRGLSSPSGLPTGAAYGFTRMLLALLKKQSPDYVAVVFDEPGPTFRHKAFKEYKATRKPMPDDMAPQMSLIRRVIDAYGIPVYSAPGFEADDVLATLARQAIEKPGVEVYLVTADKDALQLVSPRLKVYDTKTEAVLDAGAVEKEWGLEPKMLKDLFALQGDASDNVPGIPGIGPKTALELIKKYGSLEEVLSGAEREKGKRRENLIRFADQARMSRGLIELDERAPVELDLGSCAAGPGDREKLSGIFRELGFNTLLKDVSSGASGADYHVVGADEAFGELIGELRRQKAFAVDIETTSIEPVKAEIVGISFSFADRRAYYVPIMAPPPERGLGREETLGALKAVLEDPAIEKYGQNIKYDMIVLAEHGIDLAPVGFDTMVASYLLDPARRTHNLDDLSLAYLGEKKTEIADLIGRKKNQQITMDRVPIEKIGRYACEDADAVWRLAGILRGKIEEEELWELLRAVELPLIGVLAGMERTGIKLDPEPLAQMSEELSGLLAKLEGQIHKEAGGPFAINSPKQLSAILFEKLRLPGGKKTKTGYSTDASVLEALAPRHELPRLVLEYRTLSKLKSTYVDALPGMVNPRTGCIHASFNQTVTATGRLSSSDPNLQNIPVRTEMGRRVRKAFVVRKPGNVFLSADYSQIELRMLAHFSGDPVLRRAFAEGKDVHTCVASEIYRVPEGEVTPQMRREAKTVNFGLVYGQTAYGLSQVLGITPRSAQIFIDAYFKTYSRVKEFLDETVSRARRDGLVRTIMNRRRQLPEINGPDKNERSFAERTAINTVIQGSAADLIKVAMNNIQAAIDEEDLAARILLQVHDELVLEAPQRELSRVREMVAEKMEGAIRLTVPLAVSISVGRTLYDLE